MPNLVQIFELTWQDRKYTKAVKKLPLPQKEALVEQLASLFRDLEAARHPVTDPGLNKYRPTPYRKVQLKSPSAQLVEYRLKGLTRVVACYFESHPKADGECLFLLLAVTADHDHDRMTGLISRHRSEFESLD